MVCAQSNMAVDWISEKLVDRGVPVLRIGNPTRVNDKMLAFTYERRFESHPDYPQLWSIRKQYASSTDVRAKERSVRISDRNKLTERPCHRTGNSHQRSIVRRSTCDSLHTGKFRQQNIDRTQIQYLIHRRSRTSSRACLLDCHPQSRPCHSGR